MTPLQDLDARIGAWKKKAKAGHSGAQEKLKNLRSIRPYVKAGKSVRTAWRRLHRPVVHGKQTMIPRSTWEPILEPGLELPLTKAAMAEINDALRSAWDESSGEAFPGPASRSTLERWRAKLSS